MSLERRLAKLETSQTPSQVVLGWLDEAHEYPTLPEYVASLLDEPRDAWPLVRIGGAVEASVREKLRVKPSDTVWTAVRRSVGDAFFLFELVIGLNLAAEEICRFEALRSALLTRWMRALTLEAQLAAKPRSPNGPLDDPSITDVDRWRSTLSLSLTTLYTEAAARLCLEQRYLQGHPVLFSELVRESEELRSGLEGLAAVADQLPALRGSGSARLTPAYLHETAVEATPARVTELTDMARIEALDLLGENEQAASIVERRLRPVDPST
ncbi:MAG: hypothetical protein ACYDAK_13475 [Candidatus Limnocylindrales bacterium]